MTVRTRTFYSPRCLATEHKNQDCESPGRNANSHFVCTLRLRRRRLSALHKEPLAMSASLRVLKGNCQGCSPMWALTPCLVLSSFTFSVGFRCDPPFRLIHHQARTGYTEIGNPMHWDAGPLLPKGNSWLGHRTSADR